MKTREPRYLAEGKRTWEPSTYKDGVYFWFGNLLRHLELSTKIFSEHLG